MSSTPKTIAAIMSLLALALLGGCVRRQAAPAMTEISNDVIEYPTDIPGERMVTSGPPTTGRYATTEPTSISRTRIVVRVADRGVLRRNWALATNMRPSGDVLAGPTYWPTVDRAFDRPNSTNLWLEPGEFLWNTLLLPYRAIETPPWSKIVYSPAGGAFGWRNVEQAGVLYRERE